MRLKGVASVSGIPEVDRTVDDSVIPLLARIAGRLEPDRYVIALVDDPFVVAAVDRGDVVDCASSTELGAFSLRTCGELPTMDLLNLSSQDPETWRRILITEGGVYSYLSTDDPNEALRREPFLVEAMIYQMAKEIWAMTVAFCGSFKAIVLVGKLLKVPYLKDMLTKRLEPLNKEILFLEVI